MPRVVNIFLLQPLTIPRVVKTSSFLDVCLTWCLSKFAEGMNVRGSVCVPKTHHRFCPPRTTAWTPSHGSSRLRGPERAAPVPASAPYRCSRPASGAATVATLNETTLPERRSLGPSDGTRVWRSGNHPPVPSRGARTLRSSSSPRGNACQMTERRQRRAQQLL